MVFLARNDRSLSDPQCNRIREDQRGYVYLCILLVVHHDGESEWDEDNDWDNDNDSDNEDHQIRGPYQRMYHGM